MEPGASFPLRRFAACRASALLSGPALLLIAAAPAHAAGTGGLMVEVCSAHGNYWIALDTGQKTPREPGGENHLQACAHAMCPRGGTGIRRGRGVGSAA